MRASQEVKSQKSKVKSRNSELETLNSKLAEIHISGAEGLYEVSEIQKVVKKYIERARKHSKGMPDKITVTIEEIKQRPGVISSLPVATVHSKRPAESKKIAIKLLQSFGVSKTAMDKAFELIRYGNIRGAVLITAEKGDRLEPDKERGIRVSRLGIDQAAFKVISAKLSRHGLNTDTVKEALILASKVASCKNVVAELCVSDDPFYTTGYIASKKFGYIRIPNIKEKGSKSGGRAFFVKDGVSVEEIIHYLKKVPVIIRNITSCRGITSIDEILNRPHQ